MSWLTVVMGSALAAEVATAEAAGGSAATTTAATGAGAEADSEAAFLATFSFLTGAAATGAGAATTGAGLLFAGADSFLVATFFTTDLFAELIVLLPVEVFIVFKRTDYYNGNSGRQIFVKL